jgi:hypothetical protein
MLQEREETFLPYSQIRVVFHQGRAYAQENGQEWPIAEVDQSEMLWAPDGLRFAYLKTFSEAKEEALERTDPTEVNAAAGTYVNAGLATYVTSTATASKKEIARGSKNRASKGKTKKALDMFRVVIRNIRGDPVNEFPSYRPGKPHDLDWIDNQRLAYLSPDDQTGEAYVVQSADSGEILQVLRGKQFIWSPGKEHLAFISGPKNKESVHVQTTLVWPRAKKEPGDLKRKIQGSLVWSPDGEGLAFMETVDKVSHLVVLLVVDNPEGDLVWPLPDGALMAENQVFWAENKVVIGKTALNPSFSASWNRLR